MAESWEVLVDSRKDLEIVKEELKKELQENLIKQYEEVTAQNFVQYGKHMKYEPKKDSLQKAIDIAVEEINGA